MTKKAYKFSGETIEFIEIKHTRRSILKKISVYFIASLILSLGYFYVFLKITDTPEELALKQENIELIEAYKDLNSKVEIISQQFNTIEQRDENIYRSIFDINPLEIRDGGSGGTDRYANYATIKNKDLVVKAAKRIDKLSEKLKIENTSLKDLEKFALLKKNELLHTPAIQPVENSDLQRTGSGFGMRFHPILKIFRPHEGIDFICPKGSEVYATADGTVSSVRKSTTFGNVIEIKHGFGYLTIYGHLSKFNVKYKQKVKRGDIIGFVGNTGLSSGNHLHYEVHKNKQAIDPIPYFFNDLSPDEFIKMRAIADSIKQSMD